MICSDLVYDLLKQIPSGRVSSYKSIAQTLGTKGYRMIGKIVGKNPNAPQTPCHRVVKSDGSIGGYAFGIDQKIALLTKEGLEIEGGKIKNFQQKFYELKNEN